MLQNNNISFIHSSLDLPREIYSTAGVQAAWEQNGFCHQRIQRVFTQRRKNAYSLLMKACLSISYLTCNNVVHIF